MSLFRRATDFRPVHDGRPRREIERLAGEAPARQADREGRRPARASRRLSPIVCSVLAAASLLGAWSGKSAAQPAAATTTFGIRPDDADFGNYRDVVGRFARSRRPRAASDFCIVGRVAADGSRVAWVSWRQGRQIILWEPGQPDLDSSRRRLRLDKDVVESDADLHASTYLVTRAWVDDLEAACGKQGTKLHVEKSGSPSAHRAAPKNPH